MDYPFYTIGHATRSVEDFAALLIGQGVNLLADVRSVPRSLKNPQFNGSDLPAALSGYGIDYARIPSLGGFRAKSKTVPPETNAYWRHNSFKSYADYALGAEFKVGLNELIELGSAKAAAVMCAEMLWWRCHRRIITDYLLANGKRVYHIIGANNVKLAVLTENAQVTPSGTVEYPLL